MRDAFVGVMHDLATLVDSAGPGPTEMSGLGNCDHTSLIKKKSELCSSRETCAACSRGRDCVTLGWPEGTNTRVQTGVRTSAGAGVKARSLDCCGSARSRPLVVRRHCRPHVSRCPVL